MLQTYNNSQPVVRYFSSELLDKDPSAVLNSNSMLDNRNSYASLNPTLNRQNSEKRDFGVAGAIFWVLVGGLIGAAIVASSNYTLNPEAKEILQRNKTEEETSSNENINDLLGPDGKLILNEKTSKYIAEALDMDLEDREADLYAIKELIEKGGYTFRKVKNGEITEKELYSLLKEYEGNEKESSKYELKENTEKLDEDSVGETNLEAKVEKADTSDEIEEAPEEGTSGEGE